MSTKHTILELVLVLIVTTGSAAAQQTSPSPSPEKSDSSAVTTEQGEGAGDFTVISSLEFGYRGLRVDGDLNKYQSDLNYKAGPRVFDSSFLLRSRQGKGDLFETFLSIGLFVAIRMITKGELSEGVLDRGLVGIKWNAEHLVNSRAL